MEMTGSEVRAEPFVEQVPGRKPVGMALQRQMPEQPKRRRYTHALFLRVLQATIASQRYTLMALSRKMEEKNKTEA